MPYLNMLNPESKITIPIKLIKDVPIKQIVKAKTKLAKPWDTTMIILLQAAFTWFSSNTTITSMLSTSGSKSQEEQQSALLLPFLPYWTKENECIPALPTLHFMTCHRRSSLRWPLRWIERHINHRLISSR